jgi:hypothetical protein
MPPNILNYLCTYDLYSPVFRMFWMSAYPLRGEVEGPGNRVFWAL